MRGLCSRTAGHSPTGCRSRRCRMRDRTLGVSARLPAVFAMMALVSTAASAQPRGREADTRSGWTVPRTAWGAPDLRGVWDYRTMTPLQRPREFAGKTVMTDAEAAAYQARTLKEQADYDRSPSVHAKWWLDYGKELTADKRTSLIVDPPDGRIPPRTDAARGRSAARAERRRQHPADAAEYRSLGERCLTFGTPRLSGAYNNNYLLPADTGLRGHSLRDDSRYPVRAARRPLGPLVGDAPVAWRGTRLVGWRHAGRCVSQLLAQRRLSGSDGWAPARRALHAGRARHHRLRNHGRRPGDLDQHVDDDVSDDKG